MTFDIYEFLKLEDKSNRIYLSQYPQIYIYGDIVINMETNEKITLTEPTKNNTLFKQLLPNEKESGYFLILRNANNQAIYVEGNDRTGKYSYGIHKFDSNGYKVGSYFYSGQYHTMEYFLDENRFLTKVFDKDGNFLSEAYNAISYAEKV